MRRHRINVPRLARPEGCLDVISILPTAWVVEPVGTRYRSDRMGCKCDIVPLGLGDGGLTTLPHIARVSHQLEPYVSELPGLSPRGSDQRGLVWVCG